MLQKYDDICYYMFTYYEKYTVWSDEDWARIELKNKHNQNKRGDSKNKDVLFEKECSPDLIFGMWANVAGKQQIKKINFEYYQSNLPHNMKSSILVMRNNWASFDFVSGREKMKEFDDICVGGVVHNRLFNPPDHPKGMLKW